MWLSFTMSWIDTVLISDANTIIPLVSSLDLPVGYFDQFTLLIIRSVATITVLLSKSMKESAIVAKSDKDCEDIAAYN